MNKAPFSWVKKIQTELSGLDEIPLFGNAPPLNWTRLASLLSSCFHAEISLSPVNQEWRDSSEIKKGLGANPLTVAVSVTPFGIPLLWTMPRADVDKFTSRMLYEKGKGKTSEIIREGFYQYLLLEVLSSLQQIEPLQKLTFQIEEEAEFPHESSFCIDIEVQIDDKTCWGTLAIPSSFRKKWVEHFSQNSNEYFPTETARQTELILGLKTAESLLSQDEWDEMELGDFLLVEPSAYDARLATGMATLHLGSIPLFQVKIKHNQIELLDYAFTYEETMEQKNVRSNEPVDIAEEETGSIKNVPLNVTIELTRLRITLDKLMHLSPGNLLELPIHPDQGVSLCINGKKVGRGELVHLGEVLGVRILEIGS